MTVNRAHEFHMKVVFFSVGVQKESKPRNMKAMLSRLHIADIAKMNTVTMPF